MRERLLWKLLYDTAARAEEILTLNVEDLDLEFRRARVVSKGGAIEYVHWATPTARLLPRLLAGRTTGPVFLADRRAPTSGPRTPAAADIDSTTGRGRLSYPRAEYLFKTASAWCTPSRSATRAIAPALPPASSRRSNTILTARSRSSWGHSARARLPAFPVLGASNQPGAAHRLQHGPAWQMITYRHHRLRARAEDLPLQSLAGESSRKA
ncbi:tyrosine-type recombinase/integrase [Nonomuraea insulae]|uniref:Tyrosine-type recombinase/integrase n=1 Tax=Nonomuraea insulae TaxID=1616787 RepID=A0ABW1CMA2_9ACTN